MIRTDSTKVRQLYQDALKIAEETDDPDTIVDDVDVDGRVIAGERLFENASVDIDIENGSIYYNILPGVIGIDDLVYVREEDGNPYVTEDEFVDRFYSILEEASTMN